MKQYKLLETIANLLKLAGVLFAVLMLFALTVAGPGDSKPLIIGLAIFSLVGGLVSGEFLQMQIDNTKFNQATTKLLLQLTERKKKKEPRQVTNVVNATRYDKESESEKQLAALKRMKV